MNNEQRDTMLIDIHGTVKALDVKVDAHTSEIKTLRGKVDDMAGNKWQIRGLYAAWTVVASAIGWMKFGEK